MKLMAAVHMNMTLAPSAVSIPYSLVKYRIIVAISP
ncbi:hypothetical protein LINGRAHAP2_LOCUS24656 [Linum grandiflorum]